MYLNPKCVGWNPEIGSLVVEALYVWKCELFDNMNERLGSYREFDDLKIRR